jgi:lysophospholipase L1-like esterase
VRRRVTPVLAAIGAFVLVDLAIGAVLSATGSLLPVDRGELVPLQRNHATAGPANADEPWAGDLADDLADYQAEGVAFEPFLVQGPHQFASEHLNTTERERLTYRPVGLDGGPALRVAFFGGSVVFGIGQRDEHTIPSEFARASEEAGVPVEVHNYGFPRWVAWQELQYVERILAEEEPFDLVVFYDGFNEFLVQAEATSTDPTHHAATAVQDMVSTYAEEHETEPGAVEALGDLWSSYRRNSAAVRLLDRVTGRTSPVAGTPAVSSATPEEQADAALDIYRRAIRWITDVTADHATPVTFVWQPRRDGWPDEVIEALPPEVVDLSSLFVGEEVETYFDPIHTNEAGARRVAEELWRLLGPDLRAGSSGDRLPGPDG